MTGIGWREAREAYVTAHRRAERRATAKLVMVALVDLVLLGALALALAVHLS